MRKSDVHQFFCVCLGVFVTSDSSLACSSYSQTIDETSSQYEVKLSTEIETDASTVWKTLTDYSKLPTFVKGMTLSSVVKEDGYKKLVQQTGILRILFFKKEFTVLLRVHEKFPKSITMTQVEGDFDHFSAKYDINQTGKNQVRLTWEGTLKPSFYMPPIIGKRLISKSIKKQFCDVISEIIIRNNNKQKISEK